MSHVQDTVADQKVATFTDVTRNGQAQVLEQSDLSMFYIHGVDGKMYSSAEKEL